MNDDYTRIELKLVIICEKDKEGVLIVTNDQYPGEERVITGERALSIVDQLMKGLKPTP